MSLYGKSDTNQGTSIGSLIPASGLPIWILALAVYFVVMTLTNRIPSLNFWLEDDRLEPKYVGYFVGNITGILSAILLSLYVFQRYAACLYYLLVASAFNLVVALVSYSMDIKDMSSYFYSLQGLSSIPERIIGWTIGWNNVNVPVTASLGIVGPVVSVAFCALLLYFHGKRQPKAQPL